MDRETALALMQSLGYNAVMTAAGRTTEDTPQGFGPALDRAWAAYVYANSLSESPDEIPAADVYGFQSLLQAVTYDLVLPAIATLVDTSVDAPLTNAKFSQQFRAVQALRDAAWGEAASFGYGVIANNVNGFAANLNFLEPSCLTSREFG